MAKVDYEILKNEHELDILLIMKHIQYSKQIEKYCVSISDPKVIKSTKTRQKKGLIELLRNVKGWYCKCCNQQFYTKVNYTKHMISKEHKATSLGTDLIECSSKSCRKKFATQEEFQEHLQYSHKCSKSPRNGDKLDKLLMLENVKRQKYLYNKFLSNPNSFTVFEKEEWNLNMLKDKDKDEVLKENKYGLYVAEVKLPDKKNEESTNLKTPEDYLKKWDSQDKQEEAYEMEIEEAGKIWRDMVPCEGLEDVEYKLKKNTGIKTI
tara:strand:+ start:114 stop:908 length:795 start_codon:yes stop_codon:yes gene_type:complete